MVILEKNLPFWVWDFENGAILVGYKDNQPKDIFFLCGELVKYDILVLQLYDIKIEGKPLDKASHNFFKLLLFKRIDNITSKLDCWFISNNYIFRVFRDNNCFLEDYYFCQVTMTFFLFSQPCYKDKLMRLHWNDTYLKCNASIRKFWRK